MDNEQSGFDEQRFRTLLEDENFLGALILIKESSANRTEESIRIGVLANALVSASTLARKNDDREKQAFIRAFLAYTLRDWPGLASLYREQLKPSLPGFVPDNLQDIWQDFSDVMSGRKGVDESFRQRMDEAANKAREYGVDVDPLQQFTREAEKELRKGAKDLGDFLKAVFQPGAGTEGRVKPDEDRNPTAAQSEATDDASIKVKIQDADDPLPKNIHQAKPVENEKENKKTK